MRRWGVACSFVGADEGSERFEEVFRPGVTRLLYAEAITNPLVQVMDLPAAVAFAKKHRLVSVIDATFATPYNFKPLSLGFDIVVHSATKYLNGHSDVIAGVVAGKADMIYNITATANLLGPSIDPHAAFLVSRGLRTLGLRVERQNSNALALAQLLEAHPKVAVVNYPGLESSPYYERAAALFANGCGGVLSFELHGGIEGAETLQAALKLALVAPSLGGVETLITRPAATSHAGMTAKERLAQGITDGLVRIAVGVEDTADLLADFAQALEQA